MFERKSVKGTNFTSDISEVFILVMLAECEKGNIINPKEFYGTTEVVRKSSL